MLFLFDWAVHVLNYWVYKMLASPIIFVLSVGLDCGNCSVPYRFILSPGERVWRGLPNSPGSRGSRDHWERRPWSHWISARSTLIAKCCLLPSEAVLCWVSSWISKHMWQYCVFFFPGDKVIPLLIRQCRKCHFCKNPKTNQCVDRWWVAVFLSAAFWCCLTKISKKSPSNTFQDHLWFMLQACDGAGAINVQVHLQRKAAVPVWWNQHLLWVHCGPRDGRG